MSKHPESENGESPPIKKRKMIQSQYCAGVNDEYKLKLNGAKTKDGTLNLVKNMRKEKSRLICLEQKKLKLNNEIKVLQNKFYVKLSDIQQKTVEITDMEERAEVLKIKQNKREVKEFLLQQKKNGTLPGIIRFPKLYINGNGEISDHVELLVVVEDWNTAARGVDMLRYHNIGRAAFVFDEFNRLNAIDMEEDDDEDIDLQEEENELSACREQIANIRANRQNAIMSKYWIDRHLEKLNSNLEEINHKISGIVNNIESYEEQMVNIEKQVPYQKTSWLTRKETPSGSKRTKQHI